MIFYDYEIGNDKYPDAVWADEMDYEGSIICPVSDGHQRAGKRMRTLIIELDSPKIGDFTWVISSNGLMTDRVVKIFKEAGITGYEARPVIIKKVKGIKDPQLFPKLWELIITAKDGYVDPICEIYLAYECKACGLERYWSRNGYKYGILVDEKRWNGSDFFRLRDCGHRLVSERVKEVVEKYKLTNIKFTPCSEYRWPDNIAKPFKTDEELSDEINRLERLKETVGLDKVQEDLLYLYKLEKEARVKGKGKTIFIN